MAGKGAAPRMAGSLLMRGTKKHTRQQLQDEFDKIKAQVNVSGSLTGAGAAIDTVRAGLIPALRLAAEILRQPSFPESDFEQIRQAAIAQSGSRPQRAAEHGQHRDEPVSQCFLSARAIRATSRPSMRASIELKKVTLDEAKKFYADFYGASNAELAVVGDFDPAEVRKVAEELFSSWKSPKPYAVVKREWKKLAPVNTSLEAPDKTNAYSVRSDSAQHGPAGSGLSGHGSGRPHHGRRREEPPVGAHSREGGLELRREQQLPRGPRRKSTACLPPSPRPRPENAAKVEAAFKDEIAQSGDHWIHRGGSGHGQERRSCRNGS